MGAIGQIYIKSSYAAAGSLFNGTLIGEPHIVVASELILPTGTRRTRQCP